MVHGMLGETADREMSLREEVNADLTSELVERLRQIMASQRPEGVFRTRLVTILMHYERLSIGKVELTRNERRKHISKLHTKAHAFLSALGTTHPEIKGTIQTNLNVVTSDARWKGWSLESGAPIPEDDKSLEEAKTTARNILAACQIELDLLEETKGAKKGSADPALDQLLVDLGAFFETETGLAARSNCYRDPSAEEEYGGKFFHATKMILDEYARGGYGTPAALGIRILRVLKED